jgi:KaiC/GvpD/RAD55 family RecA-like ATPase
MSFEKILVAACLKEPETLRRAQRSKLKTNHLEDKVASYLYGAALEISKDSPVSKEILFEYIRLDRKLDDKQKSFYAKSAEDFFSIDTSGSNFTLKKISEKVKEKELAYTLRDSIDRVLQGNAVDGVLDELHQKVSALKAVEEAYEIYDYWEDWKERKAERLQVESNLHKGLKIGLNLHPFDRYFKRGFQPQEITAIGGPTYAGKSVMLSNFIHLAIHPFNGLNVLYIFAENKKVQAASRLDAIVLDRDYDNLFVNALKDPRGDDLFRDAAKSGYGGMKIAKVIPNEFDAMTIKSMIEDCRAEGFFPDVVAIDSPDHQVPVQKTNSSWQAKAAVYWENKALATKEEIIMLCTLPMKASSKKSEKAEAEDTAGSYDIARIADNLIFFNMKPEDRILGRASLQVVKNRDGAIDDRVIHFKFTNSLRLTPWEDAMAGMEDESLSESGEDPARTYKLSSPDTFDDKFSRTKT